MSDHRWRRDDESDTGEFGGPLFPDTRDRGRASGGDGGADQRRLRFGPDDTGPLPHWTDPPTGEIPRVTPRASNDPDDDDDEVDVWSTFTTESPVWRDDEDDADVGGHGGGDDDLATSVIEQVPGHERDDDRVPPTGPTDRVAIGDAADRDDLDADLGDDAGAPDREPLFSDTGVGRVRPSRRRDPSGTVPRAARRSGRDDSAPGEGDDRRGRAYDAGGRGPGPEYDEYGDGSEDYQDYDDEGYGPDPRAERSGEAPPARRDPGRITIGTDPSEIPRRRPEPSRRRSGPERSGRPAGQPRTGAVPGGRDLPVAVGVGAAIAALFVVALILGAPIALGIVVVVLAVAGWEYFGKVAEKGYRPAVAPGLAACALAPIAAYFYPGQALPLVIVLAFVAGAAGFIGASGVDAGPLPNMAVTTMGVVWVGLFGAFAGMILSFDWVFPGSHLGTDTMFMLALGVVANDVGALLVGSLIGKTPLRPWVSPAKTLEGLLGGTAFTVFALFVAAQLVSDLNVWNSTRWALFLAIVIAVLAPLGDLTASMFKRNLEIKDYGTIVQGHGGVLDRFDGFLFTLPGAYYVVVVMLNTRFG